MADSPDADRRSKENVPAASAAAAKEADPAKGKGGKKEKAGDGKDKKPEVSLARLLRSDKWRIIGLVPPILIQQSPSNATDCHGDTAVRPKSGLKMA